MVRREFIIRQPQISIETPDLAVAVLCPSGTKGGTMAAKTWNLSLRDKTVQREISYVRLGNSEQLQRIRVGRNETVLVIRHDDRVDGRC